MSAKKEPAKGEAAATIAAPAPGTKKKSKYLKLLVILIATGGIGGGAAYWYFGQNKSPKSAEAKAPVAKPPVYVLLEPFTVNLKIEDNPQFLQTGLSLKVTDATVVDRIKLYMPEVRDRILLLLSSRKASELLTVEGKSKLSTDIVDTINNILVPPEPKAMTKPPEQSKAKQGSEESGEQKPAAEETAAAASEAKPEQETAEVAPIPARPVLNVLFTSFIVN